MYTRRMNHYNKKNTDFGYKFQQYTPLILAIVLMVQERHINEYYKAFYITGISTKKHEEKQSKAIIL